MPGLKSEIAQERPFSSPAEEALLNLMRTADCMHRAMQRTVRPWGITSTQYNVLRILRGAHPGALTCSDIGGRMITAEPDITRLLGRLKALKLIRQERDKRDRRVVLTQIAPAGLALLAEMDPVIRDFPVQMLGHMEEAQISGMIQLLESARSHCQEHPGPNGSVTCDGTEKSAGCAPEGCTPAVGCDGVRK